MDFRNIHLSYPATFEHRIHTLQELNDEGRITARQVLKDMGVDTHEFDGPGDLACDPANTDSYVFPRKKEFFKAWKLMLQSDQASEAFDKLWVCIRNDSGYHWVGKSIGGCSRLW